MKDKLLVSFSGGETSAYMTWWICNNWRDLYDVQIVFANTGDENEDTLLFVENCSQYFGFAVTWVEAVFDAKHRVGTSHKIVDFKSASRNGEPFEEMVKKYGIPNKSYPHCTRELKEAPIRSYARAIGWKKYYTAIGIRSDEVDRASAFRKEKMLVYPLISIRPMTKQKVNFWWSRQSFRLGLKGYQGNCKACWKKSFPKLYQIAQETPEAFETFSRIEHKYENYTPESRVVIMLDKGSTPSTPYRFYRGNKSVEDIKQSASKWGGAITDDSVNTNFQFDLYDYEAGACEVFSMCGIDN